MNFDQAIKYSKVSRRTLYNWINNGWLVAEGEGPARRFAPEDLDRAMTRAHRRRDEDEHASDVRV